MLDECIFTTYGRGKIDKNWIVSNGFGSNRLYYIHSGKVFYTGSGNAVELKAGHLYFFPQNLKFELNFDKNKVIDHTYFDFITAPPIRRDSIIEIDPCKSKLIGTAAEILLMLGEEHPLRSEKEYTPLIKAYMQCLLSLIDKEYKLQTITDERISRTIKYIHQNINRQLTVSELASVCCVEENYFIRIFKQNMSVPPHKYIKNYRLKLAAAYLERGCCVSYTAERIGYSDTSSFSHSFKNEYGIYPSEYIKRFR